MRLTPARPEQTGGGPGRQAPGASSPPSRSGSAGATCPAGANHFPSGRQEDRPCGEQSCSSLGPTGADLGPRELIPCGRTRLCNLELPPLCTFSKCRRLLSRAHSPGNLRGPPATRLGPGVKVRRVQVLQTAGRAPDGRCPAGTLPVGPHQEGRTFFPGHTEGHSWWDPGRTEGPEAGLSPAWQRVTYWWECQPQTGCQGSGPLGGGSQQAGQPPGKAGAQQDPSGASSGWGRAGGHLLGPFRGRDRFPAQLSGIPCRS